MELLMSDRILVAYASRLGATAGVAEAIGKTLMDNGAQVDWNAIRARAASLSPLLLP